MKTTIIATLIILIASTGLNAKQVGKGKVKQENVDFEQFDVVDDISEFSDDVPPGLRGKDLPRGLAKKNKTPPGWQKGQKQGWKKQHNKNN